MVSRTTASLAGLLMFVVGALRADEPVLSAVLAKRLADPAQRAAAFCELLKRGKDPDDGVSDGCQINHLVVAPQNTGAPMYVVFRRDTRIFPQARIGTIAGWFTLIAADGSIVAPRNGSNVLDGHDQIFNYAGDARVAIAREFWSSDHDWTVRQLEVIPISPEQRALLSLLLGPAIPHQPSGEPGRWTWAIAETKQGAPPDIEIGPKGADGSLAKVAARFVYSRETGTYDGPKGSAAEGFVRLPDDNAVSYALRRRFAEQSSREPFVPLVSSPRVLAIPCKAGTADDKSARAALRSLNVQIEALAPDASVELANESLGRLLTLRCFAMAQENPRTVIAPGVASLKTWWHDGGLTWLRSYVEKPYSGDRPYALLPPDIRPEELLSVTGKRIDSTLPRCKSDDLACAARSAGWRMRADAFLAASALAKSEWDYHAAQPVDVNPADCAKNAGHGRGAYRRWRECVETMRAPVPSLPVGSWKAPSHGWLVVEGRRGHYDFCNRAQVFDLETGNTCWAKSCKSMLAPSHDELTGEETRLETAGSDCGRVSVDNLRELTWMAAIAPTMAPAQRVVGDFAVPESMQIEWVDGVPPRQLLGGLWAVDTSQTRLDWRWVDDNTVAARGEMTWPRSFEPAEDYTVRLLEIAEASFVAGPSEAVPATIFDMAFAGAAISAAGHPRLLQVEARLLERSRLAAPLQKKAP
jgi:hypothetical protein